MTTDTIYQDGMIMRYEKHHEAWLAHRDWLSDNKQRQGPLFIRMQRTRANCKLALRHCRIHENQLTADACASHLHRMLLNSGNLLIESIMVRQVNLHILLVVKLVQITLLKCGKNTFRICITVFLLRLIQLHFIVSWTLWIVLNIVLTSTVLFLLYLNKSVCE